MNSSLDLSVIIFGLQGNKYSLLELPAVKVFIIRVIIDYSIQEAVNKRDV